MNVCYSQHSFQHGISAMRNDAIGCLRERYDVVWGEPTLDPTNTGIVKNTDPFNWQHNSHL